MIKLFFFTGMEHLFETGHVIEYSMLGVKKRMPYFEVFGMPSRHTSSHNTDREIIIAT